MDADKAISQLTEMSPQVRSVVIADADGPRLAANVGEDAAARLADGARALLREAEALRPQPVAQIEAATTGGSVFVVREGDRLIAATTSPEPTVGLVFYDLKTCLRSLQPVADDAAA